MKLLSAGVLSAALTAGLAGSVAAYRSQVGDGGDAERPTAAAAAAPRADRPEPRVRWAPCPPGSSLERGVCVIDVVHTVVLPVPASTPSPALVVAAHSGYDDQGDDHGGGREDDADEVTDDGQDAADHEDEDHEDADHEDEGDED